LIILTGTGVFVPIFIDFTPKKLPSCIAGTGLSDTVPVHEPPIVSKTHVYSVPAALNSLKYE